MMLRVLCFHAPCGDVRRGGAGAIARPWRAGARARDLARRRRKRSPAVSTRRRSAGRCRRNAAEQVLRFHDGAVNAVALLPDGRIATERRGCAASRSGEPGEPQPAAVLEGHNGAGRRRSPFRPTARRWPRHPGTTPRGCGRSRAARRACSKATQQNVNGVAFTPDGRALVTRRLRCDAAHLAAAARRRARPIVDAADAAQYRRGRARRRDRRRRRRRQGLFLRATGELQRRDRGGQTPIIALAMSADGKLVAAAGIRGSVAIIDRATRKLERTLVGPGLPVWSVAFFPDSRTLLTGGADRMIRRWDAVSGEPVGAVVDGRPGRSARGLCRRSRRRGVSRLRRLPHA